MPARRIATPRLSAGLLPVFCALAAQPALAADLPSRKSAPVDYVRVCSVYGAGFWYVPGSDACMRLSGYVRAEFAYGTPGNRFGPAWDNSIAATLADKSAYQLSPASGGAGTFALPVASFLPGRDSDATGFRARARFNLDLRSQTDYGVLRAYFRYEITKSSGAIPGFSEYDSYNGYSSSGSSLEEAYIEWAGFLVGRAQSSFDFYANELNYTDIAGSDTKTNQFRYGMYFGKTFSASLAVEDPTTRFSALYGAAANAYPFIDSATGQYWLTPYWQGLEAKSGGTRVPDIVATLGLEQDWGKAQLSGALHQSRFAGGALFPYGPLYAGDPNFVAGSGVSQAYASSQWGYALQAGVKVDLPFIAKGDEFYLQAAFADGATGYLGPQGVTLSNGVVADQFVFPVMAVNGSGVPYYTGDTQTKAQRGVAVTAAMLHYWTPSIRQGVFGSYLRLDNPSGLGFAAASGVSGCASGYCAYRYGAPDTTVWQIGSNLIWSPVSGFDIGLELGYINSDSSPSPYTAYGRYANFSSAGAKPTFDIASIGFASRDSDDRFYARLRLQRDF